MAGMYATYAELPYEVNPETGRRRVVGLAPPQFEKTCTVCGARYFVYAKTGRSGYARCAACRIIRKRSRQNETEKKKHAEKRDWYWTKPDERRASRGRWREKNAERSMWYRARRRAEEKGLPFDITPDDIVIPERCPVLGLVLTTGRKQGIQDHASATLDRIIPERGYVKGNIAVISWRANRIKTDATAAEIAAVAEWLKVQ